MSKIPQKILDIDNKVRSNPLAWRGQFSPQLVEALLLKYCQPGARVFDPFLGSGTVLSESARLGLDAHGVEINPAAALLARTYRFINIPARERTAVFNGFEEILMPFLGFQEPLFQAQPENAVVDPKELLSYRKHLDCPYQKVLFDTLVILFDFYSTDLTHRRLQKVWRRLRDTVAHMPFSNSLIGLKLQDARCVSLPDNSIDFIITSPPYINVFNYHQKYRTSAEALGWRPLQAAPSEIGANRKHRQNRFLTVTQYCLDMAQVLREMSRIACNAAIMVFVVGRESNVRKTPFFNGKIIKRIVSECVGLEVWAEQERVFANKFGNRIFEDLIYIRNVSHNPTSSPAEIARETLEDARSSAPQESMSDLVDAIDRVDTIQSSPLFTASSFIQETEAGLCL